MAKLLPTLSTFGSERGNKLPLSYEQQLAAIARRRSLMDAMRAQGLQPTDGGKMVSGHYIADPWAGLAKIATAYMGRKGMEQADKEEADLVAQRDTEFTRAMGEVPKDTPGKEFPADGPDPATFLPGQKASPQDWIQWGGRMSKLGPQGQAIGQAAINRGIETLLPKPVQQTPTKPVWKTIELGNGMKQNGYATGDFNNPFVPVGPPFKDEDDKKKPTQLEQRLEYSTEINAIRRRALSEGRDLTPAEADRVNSLVTALNQMAAVAGADGSALTVDRTQGAIGAPTPGVQPPGAPPARPAGQAPVPPSVPVQGNPDASMRIDPAVQLERDRAALKLKQDELGAATPGTPEHTALVQDIKLTEDAIRKSEAALAKPAPGQPAITAGSKDVDPYADYRKGGAKYDPRNEPYLPQPVGPGVNVVRSGTGAQQRLNTDVAKLADDATKAEIDTFEDAWHDFRVTFAKAREKAAEMRPLGPMKDERGMLERQWDKLRFGGGAGGPAGVYNLLPQFLNTPAGQDLRRAIERVKAYERHRLFGATLTGNEKMSFEALAGTQFGMGDEQLLNAMGAMERQFNAAKDTVFGGYAPIVVDEFRRSRERNRATPQKRTWFDTSRLNGVNQ